MLYKSYYSISYCFSTSVPVLGIVLLTLFVLVVRTDLLLEKGAIEDATTTEAEIDVTEEAILASAHIMIENEKGTDATATESARTGIAVAGDETTK
jgi:hypothetical protein